LIAQAAEGSLRDAQSLLDQAVAFSGEDVQDEDLKVILGNVSREILFEASTLIIGQTPAPVFSLIEKVVEKGYDLRIFFKELIRHFRDMMLVKSVQEVEDLLPLNSEELRQLRQEAEKATLEEILRYLQALQQAEPGLRFSSFPQIYLETLLIKLCHFQRIVPLKELLEEVQRTGGGSSQPLPEIDQRTPGLSRRPERKLGSIPSPEPVRPPAEPREEDGRDNFRGLLAELQKEKSSLAAILSRQASFRIKDEPADLRFSPEKRFALDQPMILEISFPGGDEYYREAVERDIRTVERVAAGVFGRKVKVKLGGEAAAPRETRREKESDVALKDPSVQAFMDAFKATILSVEPLKGTKERE